MGGVSEITVWLYDWEHECCGPTRRVGDTVKMKVSNDGDRLTEERHSMNEERRLPVESVSGKVVAITWHPAILRKVRDNHYIVDGYGPGFTIPSTDARPDSDDWAFEFTLDTQDGTARH